MAHATARLDGPERLVPRRHAQLIAATKDTVLADPAFATPNTQDVTALFNSAPTHAREQEPVSI